MTVEVGSHSYDVTFGDTPDYGVTLPLSFGWQVPDGVDYFPTQRNPLSGGFGIVAPTLDDVRDIALGDLVTIEVYTPAAAVEPWQRVTGVVSQLEAEVGPRCVLTVYFTDPTWLLSQAVVGLGAWPLEDVSSRVQRIAAEAGLDFDSGFVSEWGMGLLAARSAGSPTDALSALRSAMKDTADRNISYAGLDHPVYGRPVYSVDPINNVLWIGLFERRVTEWPAELGTDGTLHRIPGVEGAIDGCVALTSGKWSRLPIDRPTYVLVDGIPFGDSTAPGAVPYVRNTSYVDGPGPIFPSATARTYLGRSLVPDDSTQNVVTWRTDSARVLAYLDPAPLAGLVALDDYESGFTAPGVYPWARLQPTIIEPIDPSLTLDGRTWIAGLLSGARLTIPPGGRFYVDVTIRPELVATDPAVTSGGATYADIPPALTYADLDPLLTYRDLRLIGA